MELGMIGLGRMGGNMTVRLLQKGHRVVVYDRSEESVNACVSEGAAGSTSLEDLVSQLSAPRAVWVMVPAGDPTEQTINAVAELLSPGDSIIDGGNSNYHETQRRAAAVAEKGITMLDCGTSGGIWGLTEGYSLMVGGDADAYARIEPIFHALAPSETEGVGHVGPAGSGHYVKMIHNGIEYAMMQAFAEGFEILKAKEEFELDLHAVGSIWQHGSVVRSWLLDLAVSALDKDPGLDEIVGHVSDSGEGRWTIQEAIDLDVPAHVITTSLFTRFRSRMSNTFADRMLAALRNEFGGHAVVRSDFLMTMYASASPEHPASTDDPITTIVIAGATGDLAQRKLLPALYHLWIKGRLAPNVTIVGFSRATMSTDEFREFMWRGIQEIGGIEPNRDQWDAFAPRLSYFGGDLGSADDVGVLGRHLVEIEGGDPHANRLFYLSITPAIFEPAVTSLNACGLVEESPETGWRRVVVEKPFGRDLATANALNRTIHRVFREEQVYRIDHYLGKETVQNLLVLRFANAIFEPIWNRNYVDNVQITVAESVDVGERAGYYDQFGVVRDMIQNHLLQVLALVTMEPPVTLEADSLRDKKVEALRAIRPWTALEAARNAVRAQYIGYRDARGVDPHSATPTYAAMRLYLDNWRWQGVPFYLRSGKAMARKSSEIAIQFRAPPHRIFPANPMWGPLANILTLRLQPDEGVHLRFAAKLPDQGMAVRPVDMDFFYGTEFGTEDLPEAYERLLRDALDGDASLFIRNDHIEEAWKIVDPLLEAWEDSISHPVQWYEPGTWGPETADALLSQDGRSWASVGERHGRISD